MSESSDDEGSWEMITLSPADFVSGLSVEEIIQKNKSTPIKGSFKILDIKQ